MHDIEDDDVVVHRKGVIKSGFAVFRHIHGVPFLFNALLYERRDLLLVFDYKPGQVWQRGQPFWCCPLQPTPL